MKETVDRIEPAKGREKEAGTVTQVVAGEVEMRADRQNSVFSNEPIHLKPEGDESDQVNGAERADEQVSRSKVRRRPDIVAPQQPGEKRGGAAMPGHDRVGALRDWRKAGH